jgi:hypothetical protein
VLRCGAIREAALIAVQYFQRVSGVRERKELLAKAAQLLADPVVRHVYREDTTTQAQLLNVKTQPTPQAKVRRMAAHIVPEMLVTDEDDVMRAAECRLVQVMVQDAKAATRLAAFTTLCRKDSFAEPLLVLKACLELVPHCSSAAVRFPLCTHGHCSPTIPRFCSLTLRACLCM